MTDLLTAALQYADDGWHVFPVWPEGKQPLVTWREQATDDEQQITEWWTRWPDANIGGDCHKSRMQIIDVDRLDAIDEMEQQHGALPDTRCVLTGKGLHLHYQGAPELTNATAKVLPDGVDVRASGGYVLLPPSVHPDGGTYEWSNPDKAIAPFPSVVRQAWEELQQEQEQAVSVLPDQQGEGVDRVATEWGQTVLQGELSKLMQTGAGQGRNNQLFASGLLVFGAAKGGHLSPQDAELALRRAALSTGLSAAEADPTIRSAFDRADARTPPDRPLHTERTVPDRPLTGSDVDLDTAPAAPGGGFDLLDLDALANLPTPKWLLDRRVPEGLSVLVGPPSVGKSFIGLDWSLTIAALQDRPIVYMAGEGVAGLRLRIEAWRQANRQLTPSNFHVVATVPRFMDPAQVAKLQATVAQHEPALLVIDTLARAITGGDENNALDMGLFVDALDQSRERHGTSSLVLHHTNKGGGERGSSALRGAADILWMAERDVHTDEIVVKCDKPPKDGERPADAHHMLRQVGESAVLHQPTWQMLSSQEGVPL